VADNWVAETLRETLPSLLLAMSLEQNDTLGQSDNVGVIESLSDHVDQEVFSDPAAERAECSPPRDTSPPPAPAPTSVSVDSFSPNETFFAVSPVF
jgi:hypothetical protein